MATKKLSLKGLVIPGQAGKCTSMASQQLSSWEESDAAMRGWGLKHLLCFPGQMLET